MFGHKYIYFTDLLVSLLVVSSKPTNHRLFGYFDDALDPFAIRQYF